MLEKPIALELWEADELIQLAKRNNLKFTIGYSQRFNPKIAYAKKKIVDGTLLAVGVLDQPRRPVAEARVHVMVP